MGQRNTVFFATAIFVVLHSDFVVPLQTHAYTDAQSSHSPSFFLLLLLLLLLLHWVALLFRSSSSLFFLYIYSFFLPVYLTPHSLSPFSWSVCVCGAAVISEEESECKREGGEPLSCVRASATGMERLVGGWGRRRQRHLWSGPTNLIFHVSPSRSHSLRTKLSHKNVYFVSPHICF